MKIKWWHLGLLFCLGLALLAPFASSLPDGLETVAINNDFADKALESPFQVAPDYSFTLVHNETIALLIGALGGTIIIFALTLGLGYLLRARRTQQKVL